MQHRSVFILGRQPAIGRAELESLFGADHLEPIGSQAMACDIAPQDVPFDRLGSAIRLARPIGDYPTANWPQVAQATIKLLPTLLDQLPPDGKLKLGLSTFDMNVNERHLLRTGLELKKVCKNQGRSVRIVPNTESALNTAQVIHNQLTGELGIELLFIRDGKQVYLAQTVRIQDIDTYAKRDQGRPKRDAFVGMLPPKLAQTIVNLGVGQLEPSDQHVVLDPFCGTGVVLQEALLMGYGAYGTDLEPRMIDYSQANLEWLNTHFSEFSPTPKGPKPALSASPERSTGGPAAQPVALARYADSYDSESAGFGAITLEVGDATTYKWQHAISAVACETYLGRPISSWPNPEKLQEIMGTCNVIVQKFMRNLAEQVPAGTRLCLAIPAWVGPNGRVHHLSLLDQLEVLGYNRVSFSWAEAQEMVYRRPDQLVARELLVITRK